MIKNVFEYLEYSFGLIFSERWYRFLRTPFFASLAIGFVSLVFIGISATVLLFLYQRNRPIEILLIVGLLMLFIVLILGFVATSFSAIIIPYRSKYWDITSPSFADDILLWKRYISRYFVYVTYWSFLLFGILLFLIAIVSLGFFFLESGFLFFLLGVGALWFFAYSTVRFTFSWYHILFSEGKVWDLLLQSFHVLKWNVWNVFKKVFAFNFILWLWMSIIQYMIQFLFPDMTTWITPFDSVTSLESFLYTLQEVLTSHLGIIVLFALTTFILGNISSIIAQGMKHSFLVQYYTDFWQEKEPK